MKALFIGGTGTISMAITRALAGNNDWELFLLNRGNRNMDLPENVTLLQADINDEATCAELLKDNTFDVVCDFIGFIPKQLERDYRLFTGKTKQFMYISSASAYQKPVADYRIAEETPLENPYWEYSRNKIACEEYLMQQYREKCFPVTIIRPSHTYDERSIPLGVHGDMGSWQVIQRMLAGKPVIIHGDGTSLWTLTHNSDFAKGFIGLMGNPKAIGQVYQITSDESLTWNQIYETIAQALGVELHPYYVASDFLDSVSSYDFRGSLIGDKSNTVVFDNSKLKAAVPGFQAAVPFKEGVRKTLDYVLSHPECQVPDPEFDSWCDRVINTLEAARQQLN